MRQSYENDKKKIFLRQKKSIRTFSVNRVISQFPCFLVCSQIKGKTVQNWTLPTPYLPPSLIT